MHFCFLACLVFQFLSEREERRMRNHVDDHHDQDDEDDKYDEYLTLSCLHSFSLPHFVLWSLFLLSETKLLKCLKSINIIALFSLRNGQVRCNLNLFFFMYTVNCDGQRRKKRSLFRFAVVSGQFPPGTGSYFFCDDVRPFLSHSIHKP